MFASLDISKSGLIAQRIRMDVIAGNIAMSEVTEDEHGRPNPYRRRFVVFQQAGDGNSQAGVKVAEIKKDMSDFELKYDPGHKDAIKEGPYKGYVRYPNIDLALEQVDAIEAVRAYEANLASYDLSKSMIASSLRILG